MTVRRMDHVGIVVEDIDEATAFFVELGLERTGGGAVEGGSVDRVTGVAGVRARIAMMRIPGGPRVLELSQFDAPPGPAADPGVPANVPGIRHLSFLVDDLREVLGRLEGRGAELVGTVEEFPGAYRLCYVRGPAGIIVELAEAID